jgi:pantoate--beta-alanine ligase
MSAMKRTGQSTAEYPALTIVASCTEGQRLMDELRSAGKTVGLVPTMGALHEGHFSLVRAAQRECDVVVVTIFVNPIQFGPHEDFQRYPRPLEADIASLARLQTGFVFAPSAAEMFPAGFGTYVEPAEVSRDWEGPVRPGHFRGVATVVLKLFHILPAHYAYFGRKDYQQTLVVQHLVRDLNVPIQIQVCPTVREPDGLALSSRNQYLDAEQRRQAAAVPGSLRLAQQIFAQGQRQAGAIDSQMRAHLAQAGIDRIDYIALTDPGTLQPMDPVDETTIALLAVRVGETRLIDNVTLSASGG